MFCREPCLSRHMRRHTNTALQAVAAGTAFLALTAPLAAVSVSAQLRGYTGGYGQEDTLQEAGAGTCNRLREALAILLPNLADMIPEVRHSFPHIPRPCHPVIACTLFQVEQVFYPPLPFPPPCMHVLRCILAHCPPTLRQAASSASPRICIVRECCGQW